MQHGIDCLNFNDKTYSLHKNLAPKTGKCYHGRTKTRFSQRSRRTPDDGNSSLSRFVRSGHKRASRYHQARSKDQRSSDRGGAHQQRIETMFLATSIKWSYLSSTIVKEAAYYGSDIGKFVTPNVEKAVNEKYALIRQKKDPET